MTLTRDERDRFAARTPNDIAYGEGACLETPRLVFENLNKRFQFDVDLTANEKNHLLPYWFGPGAATACQDALTHSWTDTLGISVTERGHTPSKGPMELPDGQLLYITGGDWVGTSVSTIQPKAGFSNPPYGSFIPKILKKALEERDKGFTSVFLLPNRAAGWFQDLVIPYYSELWFCEERIPFWYQGKPRPNAVVTPTKIHLGDGRIRASQYEGFKPCLIARQQLTWEYSDGYGNYSYQFEDGDVIKEPAGAMFDSIIVVYKPITGDVRHIVQGELFPRPPAQRPNVWNPRTGELRY